MNRNKSLALNLQLFADANTQTTLLSGLSAENKTYYEKSLIMNAEPNLVHDQFASKYPIPKNGGKTVEFRKYDSLAKASTPLTEGVTPDGNNLNVSTINAEVSQYGAYVTISDILDLTAIDNNIVQATKILGSQAGRTLDSIVRDVLAGGTNVVYAGGKESRSTLAETDTLKPVYFFQAAAQLEAMNAPKIEGNYVAIIHPYAAFDLMTSPEWVDVHKYADPEAIFNGEIGKLGNVRFVSSSESKIWKDDSCPAQSYVVSTDESVVENKGYYTRAGSEGSYLYKKIDSPTGNPSASSYYEKKAYSVFSTLVLGSEAYAVTEVEGGGLQVIVKQRGAGDDPLDQRSTVGWKAIKTAERLVEQYMVRIESCSSYSNSVGAN